MANLCDSRLILSFFNSISIMQILVMFACQCDGMFPPHAASLSVDIRVLSVHSVVRIHEEIVLAGAVQQRSLSLAVSLPPNVNRGRIFTDFLKR